MQYIKSMAAAGAAVMVGVAIYATPTSSQSPTPPTIVVTATTPNFDVNDPSNLQEAAVFAWQEFIALTWPAPAQGPTSFPRGVPLTDWLRQHGVDEVVVVGIATDYCVLATAQDAARGGFTTTVISDLTAGVAPETSTKALDELRSMGVAIAST